MLLVVPVAAAVAAISFTDIAVLVWDGVAVRGMVNGLLDSVVKAVVRQLVGPGARAAGFGWLALVRGVGLLAAGAVLGMAYQHSAGTAVVMVLAVNVVGLLELVRVLRALPDHQPA